MTGAKTESGDVNGIVECETQEFSVMSKKRRGRDAHTTLPFQGLAAY